MNYQTVFGVVAVVIGLSSFVLYFYNIFYGKIKPHAFSWFIWGLLEAIVFFASISRGGGAGAWATGVTSLLCFTVSLIAFSTKNHHFMRLDWFCLCAAFFGILFWRVTGDPLTAVIIVTITDAIGFVPTFRKSYFAPHEEMVTMYALSAAKLFTALFALESLNLTTTIYPLTGVITNTLFTIMLLMRRRII